MSHWLMKVVGFANGRPCPFAGMYLETFTPDAETKGSFTPDADKAMRFASMEALLETWKHQIGVRRDGKPDRPLTAFTIEARKVE